MSEYPIIWEWLSFAVRWVHVITAIAWIGSSFYFIALDLGLRKHAGLPKGAHGEEWQVHGGGFYHIQKYLVAPETLPEHLTWFKWESYATWLSGAAMLMVMYWVGGEIYLIDRDKFDMGLWQAIALSAGSLIIGWLVYHQLCKSPLGYKPTLLMVLLFALIVLMSWGYAQVFTGRAALLHLGAFTATIMAANVFVVIIPNQRIVVGDLQAGRTPNPEFGRIAKLRSTHNNYLTLPVIFLMLSNHNPLAFGTDYAWIIASLVFLMGVSIRHYSNTKHARAGNPYWTWAVTAALFVAIVWISSLSKPTGMDLKDEKVSTGGQPFVMAANFGAVRDVVLGRCAMCHANEPAWDGFATAPAGVLLETDEQIARRARDIYLQAGRTHAMPPGNVTYMEEQERAEIVRWYKTTVAGS